CYVVPRKPQRRFFGLKQAAAVLLAVVLCLISLFAVVNRANIWFGRFSDLTAMTPRSGNTPQVMAPTPTTTVSPREWTAATTQLQREPLSNPTIGAQLSDQGSDTWAEFTLAGTASSVSSRVLVWLPPSYLSHPDQHYPVLMAFGGYPGDPVHYRDNIELDQLIRHATANHELRESIIVIPDVYPGKLDSECVDATTTGGSTWETWVSVDVVQWVQTNLRAIDDPQAWATMGFSAGGYCAALMGVRHSHQFGLVMNLSGSYAPVYTGGQQWTAPEDPRYDLAKVAAAEKPAVKIYASYGVNDVQVKGYAEAFSAATSSILQITMAPVTDAAHSPASWETAMVPALTWCGANSPYFAFR
ncbi:MAG: alpha/beta hydrolase, partial [Propionibacteriaceae bacterium]